MLLIFAHPDDESFSCGGTVPKYVRAGWQVDLICATNGEDGSVGPYTNATADTLGSIRQKELEKAAETLGISSVTFLEYPDGALSVQNPGELEDKIFRKMIEVTPRVVITFEPRGISNHPDHMRLSTATTFAFQKYAASITEVQTKKMSIANPPRHARERWKIPFADTVAHGKEPKLYYASLPDSAVRYLVRAKVIPKESFGKPWVGVPDDEVTTVIDVRRFTSTKKKALLSHVTQTRDVEKFYALASHPLASTEYFVLRMQGTTEVFMGKHDRVSGRL